MVPSSINFPLGVHNTYSINHLIHVDFVEVPRNNRSTRNFIIAPRQRDIEHGEISNQRAADFRSRVLMLVDEVSYTLTVIAA